MQAMILCAGRGSRLAAARGKTPKPLVAVGGVSLLAGRIAALADAGFSRFVVNVSPVGGGRQNRGRASRVGGAVSRADSKSAFRAKNRRSKPRAEIGFALRRGALDSDSPFVAVNADILCDFDCARLRDFRAAPNSILARLVFRRQSAASSGGRFCLARRRRRRNARNDGGGGERRARADFLRNRRLSPAPFCGHRRRTNNRTRRRFAKGDRGRRGRGRISSRLVGGYRRAFAARRRARAICQSSPACARARKKPRNRLISSKSGFARVKSRAKRTRMTRAFLSRNIPLRSNASTKCASSPSLCSALACARDGRRR